MTAARVLTSKWMLVLGAVAILGLTASQTLADPPGGGHYRPSPVWSSGPGGHGPREMPFRGERFGGPGGYGPREMSFHGERFLGGHERVRPLPPPCGPQWSGGCIRLGGYAGYISGGGLTITVIIR